VSASLRLCAAPLGSAEEDAMACTTDTPHGGAEPLSGFRMGRAPLAGRGNIGPGWRIPRARTPGDADAETPSPLPVGQLNDRDLQLVEHLADGRSTAQIAAAMSVSSNTARTRIRRVSGKLAVNGRAEIVQAARLRGLV
jgi:DNA-binding CsgD family transcriptional regulator